MSITGNIFLTRVSVIISNQYENDRTLILTGGSHQSFEHVVEMRKAC